MSVELTDSLLGGALVQGEEAIRFLKGILLVSLSARYIFHAKTVHGLH